MNLSLKENKKAPCKAGAEPDTPLKHWLFKRSLKLSASSLTVKKAGRNHQTLIKQKRTETPNNVLLTRPNAVISAVTLHAKPITAP